MVVPYFRSYNTPIYIRIDRALKKVGSKLQISINAATYNTIILPSEVNKQNVRVERIHISGEFDRI